MNTLAYVLLTSCEDIRATVLFNDWHAIDIRKDRGVVSEAKVNAFVVEGENSLQLVLRRSKTGKKPNLRLTFVVAPHGPEEAAPVIAYEWIPDLHPLPDDPKESAVVLEHKFTVGKAFGRWSWEGARAFMPTDESDVADVVMTYHDAFRRRDADQITELIRTRAEENGRSVELDSADMVEVNRLEMQKIANASSFSLEPLSKDELTFRSGARGRLVDVRRRDGDMPIKGMADGEPFGFEAVLSAVDGGWKIVR